MVGWCDPIVKFGNVCGQILLSTEFKFDVEKCIIDTVNKAGLKKDNDVEIKINSDLYQGVYDLFRTIKTIGKFQEIAKELQRKFIHKNDIEKFISSNMSNENLTKLIDGIMFSEFNINDFYGYRHEISLDQENILEKTIIPTNTFNKYKEQKKEFNETSSYRILFEQAILVLKCDEKAKQCLPEKFKKGVIFRELHAHKKRKRAGLVTDSEVINKILLIPAATGGQLIDDNIIEELKNLILSESKHNTVVITKLDKSSSYEEYTQNNYDGYIGNLKEQIVITHNNLIAKLEKIEQCNVSKIHKFDRKTLASKIVASFDNAYLSKITRDKEGCYDAELHKIVCRNKSSEEISVYDIDDIIIFDNYHTLISSILGRENRLAYG